MSSVTSRVIAEMLLGKIRFGGMREPEYLQQLREAMLVLKKRIGDDFDKLQEDLLPVIHVIVDMVFDAATGTAGREQTLSKLRQLSVPNRVMVEQMVAQLTGKMHADQKWNHGLWNLKTRLERIANLSISGVTLTEIREGYDTLVHEVVDELYKNRATLTS